MNKILYIIVPCYNEQDVLPITAPKFRAKIESFIRQGIISDKSRVLFVDDGSNDDTWKIITKLAKEAFVYCGIRQSRNRGHQSTVLSGLMETLGRADLTISIDCDGQDDIDAMDEMLNAYYDGYDIVYGVRSSRKTDTFFKRFTAESFYKLLNQMGAEVVYNHADYRLVPAKVLKEFSDYKEVNLFLRGMFPLVGFKSTSVYYSRNERIAGKSHYTLRKMLSLAFDGITSLSVKPLRIITGVGSLASVISFAGIVWAITRQLAGHAVTGWTSTVCVICFMGGIQLVCLGVLGEYIGKIYMEVKHRPRYIISERTDNYAGK